MFCGYITGKCVNQDLVTLSWQTLGETIRDVEVPMKCSKEVLQGHLGRLSYNC